MKRLALMLILVPTIAFAEEDPFDGRLIPVELIMEQRKAVGISREQHSQIGKLVVEVQKSVAEKQWQLQEAYFGLLAALDEETIDEKTAVDLAARAVGIENEIKVEQVRLLVRVRNLLDSQQIEELREIMAQQKGG